MTDPNLVEAVARAMCKADGTAQCAAICLSYFASSTSDGKCPEALQVWKRKAEFACTAVIPLIRAAALEEAAEVAEASADDLWEDDGGLLHSTRKLHGVEIAAAIRSLIPAQEKQEG